MAKIIQRGTLDGFFETGCEGVMWVLATANKRIGYDGLLFIEPGDHLTVYNLDGSVAFRGKIRVDYKTGWREYPLNPEHGQQCALGFWIHWIQRGWEPDEWAKLFIKHWFKKWKNCKPLRAELIQKKAT